MTSLATHGANALLAIVPMLDAHSEYEMTVYIPNHSEGSSHDSILSAIQAGMEIAQTFKDYLPTISIRALGEYGCVAKFTAHDLHHSEIEFGMIAYHMLSNGFAPE